MKIVGINGSERQVEICRVIAPRCTFAVMDATNMSFEAEHFDNLLCIEAAMHFMTRRRFLEEAFRVLKPGGKLAMSDILYDEYLLDLVGPSHPKENYLAGLGAYEEMLRSVGFRHVRIDDVSEFCWRPYMKFTLRKMERECDRDPALMAELLRNTGVIAHHIADCHVYAIK